MTDVTGGGSECVRARGPPLRHLDAGPHVATARCSSGSPLHGRWASPTRGGSRVARTHLDSGRLALRRLRPGLLDARAFAVGPHGASAATASSAGTVPRSAHASGLVPPGAALLEARSAGCARICSRPARRLGCLPPRHPMTRCHVMRTHLDSSRPGPGCLRARAARCAHIRTRSPCASRPAEGGGLSSKRPPGPSWRRHSLGERNTKYEGGARLRTACFMPFPAYSVAVNQPGPEAWESFSRARRAGPVSRCRGTDRKGR
jgi:hypothetical protein